MIDVKPGENWTDGSRLVSILRAEPVYIQTELGGGEPKIFHRPFFEEHFVKVEQELSAE